MRYRVTFETVDAQYADQMQARFGENVWFTIGKHQWETMPWHSVTSEGDEDNGILDQHMTLKRWAQTHEQPIRGVKLERQVSQPVWEAI